MASQFYPAVVERAADGFGVFFPDVPGCTSAGATITDALAQAELALQAHLDLLAELGEAIPEPSDLAGVRVEPDVEIAALLLARAEPPGRSVRVNITVPEAALEAIDRHARRLGLSRSAFLVGAAREAVQRGLSAAPKS
jgi:predicted RNase H-like HicB family nuclease